MVFSVASVHSDSSINPCLNHIVEIHHLILTISPNPTVTSAYIVAKMKITHPKDGDTIYLEEGAWNIRWEDVAP